LWLYHKETNETYITYVSSEIPLLVYLNANLLFGNQSFKQYELLTWYCNLPDALCSLFNSHVFGFVPLFHSMNLFLFHVHVSMVLLLICVLLCGRNWYYHSDGPCGPFPRSATTTPGVSVEVLPDSNMLNQIPNGNDALHPKVWGCNQWTTMASEAPNLLWMQWVFVHSAYATPILIVTTLRKKHGRYYRPGAYTMHTLCGRGIWRGDHWRDMRRHYWRSLPRKLPHIRDAPKQVVNLVALEGFSNRARHTRKHRLARMLCRHKRHGRRLHHQWQISPAAR
jgi:hypothetical protein